MRAKESRRNAALKRIVAEEWEPLIAKAVEARADYIEALGDIAWLLRNGAAPANDARGAQLLVETDTAPSRWQAASLAQRIHDASLRNRAEDGKVYPWRVGA
jgi:hypothetical protein